MCVNRYSISGASTQVMSVVTLASAGDVRVALVAGVAVARKASVLLPAAAVLALAKAIGYILGALPQVAGRRWEALLNRPP